MKGSLSGDRNLSRLRRRAAWGYWAESLMRVAAPACGILVAYLVVALFGYCDPWASLGIWVLAAAVLGYGLSRLRRPAAAGIDRRIERASGLAHRPLAMLQDMPENDNPMAMAIWQIHQRRIAESLGGARPGRPFVDAVARDPLALRGLLLLLLLAAGIVAGPQAGPRLEAAFVLPAWPFVGPSVNAWITPPAFTGDPPLVLAPGQAYTVLAGSMLTVVVDGVSDAPAMRLGSKPLRPGALAQNSYRGDAVLTAPAKLRVGSWWHPLAHWKFDVLAAAAPEISLKRPFTLNRQLVLDWQARDRYGLDALTAILAPVGHGQAAPELLILPINAPDPRNASGVAKPDIGDSPYAGLAVSVVLEARNLAGMQTSTPRVIVTLPPPMLHDKTAMALARLRQVLALAPGRAAAAGAALAGLAQHPLSRITGSADVQMATLAQALRGGEISNADAQNLLETLAQQIESGPDYQPARALAAASQALEQALQQAENGGKSLQPGRLQKLLAALQAALAQHLQALGSKMPDPSGSGAQNGAAMNEGDLNRMAEQIAQDEAAGRTGKAQAELRQLEQVLSALQSAKPMSAADAQRAATASQAAQDLAKMTQGESKLLDQTNQGKAAPGGQAALADQLASTRERLGKAGIRLPDLGDAAKAMGTAQNALGGQDEEAASAAEAGAIRALQKASAALTAASRGFSFDAGQMGAGEEQLENGASGAPDESPVPSVLPSAGNAAGIIQQQIIKNDSDPALPDAVHRYYHRLLNQDAP